MFEDQQEVTVSIMDHEAGITHGCKTCLTVHREGRYAVCLQTEGKLYFVCEAEPSQCCGEEKHWPLLFTDEAAAEVASTAVSQHIRKHASIEQLHLAQFS